MNVLVIGHLSLDLVKGPHGDAIQEYGGIARAITTLGSLAGARDQVVPVCAVPAADLPALGALFEPYPAVSTAGLFTGHEELPRIPGAERAQEGHAHEHHPQSPIPFERIRRHLSAERVLINMVSGRDITLETMDEIRMAVRDRQVPIHLDMHNLTLRHSPTGALVRGPVELWRRWAFMVDTVQLNEQEIAALTTEKSDELHTAGHLLTLGSRAVIVTRGERGVSVYTNEHKRLVREDLPLEEAPAVMAGLGCGDVFGAAFVARRSGGDDPLQAARAASRVASQRCRGQAATTLEKA